MKKIINKVIVLLIVFALSSQALFANADNYDKGESDNSNIKRDPYVLMYDSNQKLLKKIDQLVDMPTSDNYSESPIDGIMNDGSDPKNHINKVDRDTKEEIKESIKSGKDIRDLDLPEEVGTGACVVAEIPAGATVVLVPAVTAAAIYLGTVTVNATTGAIASFAQAGDASKSSSSNGRFKKGDATPDGYSFTTHGAFQANNRGFTGQKIDDIIANPSQKVYQIGGKTVYAKKTGNFYDVVIVNSDNQIVSVVGGSDKSLRTWNDVTKMLNNNGGYSSLPIG